MSPKIEFHNHIQQQNTRRTFYQHSTSGWTKRRMHGSA